MESFFISNYFDSYGFAGTVIATVQDLSKRSFSKSLDYFIAICEVIVGNHNVVAPLIVVAVVVRRIVSSCHLFTVFVSDVVDRRII